MMTRILLALGLVLVAVCGVPTEAAIKWNLTASIQSPLSSWIGYPPDDPSCTVLGVCQPYVTVIPNNTVWIWCGWSTKYRTQYWVPSFGPNVSVTMMRQKEVSNCALNNLTKIKNCQFIADTTCDTSTNCIGNIYGMSFVDPSCVLVANNDKKPANVSITVWQYNDPSRNVGTVFSIILLIIILGFTLGHMGYTCYTQIRKPSHRLDELEKLARAKLAQASSIGLQEINSSLHARDASEAHPGVAAAAAKQDAYGELPVGVTGSSVALIAGGSVPGAAGSSGVQDARTGSGGGGGGQARVSVALGSGNGAGGSEQTRSGNLLDRIVNLVSVGGPNSSNKGTHAH